MPFNSPLKCTALRLNTKLLFSKSSMYHVPDVLTKKAFRLFGTTAGQEAVFKPCLGHGNFLLYIDSLKFA